MNNILVLGAGRSSSSLIAHLLHESRTLGWQITVGDLSEDLAKERIAGSRGTAIRFDIHDEPMARETISKADIVISLLPPPFHPLVARHCVTLRKHLLNASYVSEEMKALDAEAKQRGLLLLNECGLDPGIDHMSAMQVMDEIKDQAGKIISFESFTGGLIAPETDAENPWRYKFTWNPRNVVMAGQGTAMYLQEGQFKYIPYQRLFQRLTSVSVPGYGEFEGYANRDSLKYRETYGLSDIKTMLRGTLRNKGFCSAWNVLVQLGCCDDTYIIDGVEGWTHRDFINSFLEYDTVRTIEEKLCIACALDIAGEEMKRLRWSGLFSTERLGMNKGTPAQILEHILNKRWKLNSGDKDLIVMWHRFIYEQDGVRKEIQAHLTATGRNEIETAMARTVGLPLAVAAKLLFQGKIAGRGVVIPVTKEIYEPVLLELSDLGISLSVISGSPLVRK